jgi:hypothetical protein
LEEKEADNFSILAIENIFGSSIMTDRQDARRHVEIDLLKKVKGKNLI